MQLRNTTKLLLLFLFFSSCTVRLISDYDEATDQGVTQIEKAMDFHLIEKEANPQEPFRQGFYDTVKTDLRVLVTRAAAIPKNEATIADIKDLGLEIDRIETKERKANSMAGYYAISDSTLDDICQSILTLELAKKK